MGNAVWLVVTLALIGGCARGQRPAQAGPAGPRPAPLSSAQPVTPPSASTAACTGANVDLLAAIGSPACQIDEEEATRLRAVLEDPSRAQVKVEARTLDGSRVELRIVNRGNTSLELPFFVHADVDAFPARANGRILRAASPEWPPGAEVGSGRELSKIELPPAGVARAVVVVDPHVIEMRSPRCPPNAKCRQESVEVGTLPMGQYSLTLGTPIYASREDLRATLQWSVGPTPGAQPCPPPSACAPGQTHAPGCPGGRAPAPGACPPSARCVPKNALLPACPKLP